MALPRTVLCCDYSCKTKKCGAETPSPTPSQVVLRARSGRGFIHRTESLIQPTKGNSTRTSTLIDLVAEEDEACRQTDWATFGVGGPRRRGSVGGRAGGARGQKGGRNVRSRPLGALSRSGR